MLLTNLVTLDGAVSVRADGTDSQVDLARLATVTGTNGSAWFTAEGGGEVWLPALATVQDGNLAVREGGVLALPALQSYVKTSCSGTMGWEARGTNSVLDLPMLTHLAVSGDCGHHLSIQALAGGQVVMPSLAALDGAVYVTADGSGSLADLSRLTEKLGTSGYGGFTAREGGEIRLPVLGAAARVSLTTGVDSALVLPALAAISDGNLALSGGGVLSLPGLQSYERTTCSGSLSWQVQGSNSVIELPGLTNLVVSGGCGHYLSIQALAGGRMLLTNLVTLDGAVSVRADGPDSVVDLARLTTVTGTNGSAWFTAESGGEVWLPALATVQDGNLAVREGGVLALPALQSYVKTSCSGTMGWEARGTNSVLALPMLTHLVVSGDCGHYLGVQALAAGRVVIANLGELGGRITFRADGTGSVIDLAHLRAIADTGLVEFNAANGGLLRIAETTQIGSSNVRIISEDPGSVIDFPALVHFNAGALEARNQGAILSPRLLFLDHAALVVRNGGRMDARQIRRLLNSAVTIDNATLVFRDLYNWLGTTFSYPNGGRGEFPPVVDLNLGDLVLSTNALWAGDPLTVSWAGLNSSTNPILAPWTDAVYLSADDRWDIDDLLLGTFDHPDGLSADTGFSGSVQLMAPGVMPANYYILVRADFFNQVNELTAESNNIIAYGPVAAGVHVLPPDGAVRTNQFLAAKHARYFQVPVPAQEDLRIRLTLPGGRGATELYGSLGTIPSRSLFDQRHDRPLEPNQSLRVPGTVAGIYYILAFADVLASEPSEFTISAELLAFGLEQIAPSTVGAGRFTLVVDGARWRADSTVFTLEHAHTGTRFAAVETAFESSARAYATFDLTDADSGPYHFHAEDGGEATRLASVLTVETARQGNGRATGRRRGSRPGAVARGSRHRGEALAVAGVGRRGVLPRGSRGHGGGEPRGCRARHRAEDLRDRCARRAGGTR